MKPGGAGTETGTIDWHGPGARSRRVPFTWRRFVWAVVYPKRGHRIMPTLPGLVLIGLSFGIGTAAYNSSSNILFITLSLLLSCLILSGVLSWLNVFGLRWRLVLAPPLRAGHDTVVALELQNGKRFLPTYGLWFEFAARPAPAPGGHLPESTISAPAAEVRAAWNRIDEDERRARVPLSGRLDPRGEGRVEWVVTPSRRGRWRVALASVGSLFPFGFLRKDVATELFADAVVWPAPVEYRRFSLAVSRRISGGERVARTGSGGDLLALRRYTAGDSHRLIHWKASARTRTLLVRQFAAETAEGYALWLRTDAGVWTRPEQFELLVSFAATLAEDLFRANRLLSVAIDAGAPMPVRRVHDLELFLDQLAVLVPREAAAETPGQTGVARQHVLTFSPEGARGVAAYVGAEKFAAT